MLLLHINVRKGNAAVLWSDMIQHADSDACTFQERTLLFRPTMQCTKATEELKSKIVHSGESSSRKQRCSRPT